MSLDSRVALSVQSSLTSVLDLVTPTAPLRKSYATSLTDGTTAGKADRLFADTRTLAASATEDLDLAGVLADPLGAALTFVKIKAIVLKAASTNANNVVVGAAAANGWATFLNAAGTITLRPGATFAAFVSEADSTAYAVTAATGDLLKVANSAGGTAVSYDIIIIGTSA